MTCFECGGKMRTRRENYRYEASGLPVTLKHVEVSRCEACGEIEVAIPAIDMLHRVMAGALIRKRQRLAPAEIRFLRKYLGWSGADFAQHMGTTAETVSRWENGRKPMGPVADRLLRLMVAKRAPVSDYTVDVLAQIAADDKHAARPVRLGLIRDEEGWHYTRDNGAELVPA
ncbi:MAG TPA: type II TA system antitoxin MqsA family protein [Candidatus Tectomicrobia bacterium]|nr:type II TA system antitoxin MqsA family protein [Candidatus Tectomicrobia bacterium]